MGEWSEYFADFPEEDQANYIGGRFDPAGAAAARAREERARQDQAALDSEIHRIIKKHSRR